ncbi:hypothetical protein C4901_14315 [Acidiferrobacter sp. SPIII_3]|uniref:porin n=1 Tax=Acidiferrobacter sp. SPIII_3 TaxID=1281578 RepID=UPI000D72B4C9|nr:porin [Acidiferrobacter sp. SPIII_3]AWP24350.1 hypothetical protein C4901_14315 [Acidiferrobacter sp. SPIII_3]
MKCKVLTAAVSAALVVVPMAAVAGVKIGGMAQGEIGYWKDTSKGVVQSQGTNMLDNGRGRLWIEADQKLGYGLTGMAYYMLKINTVGGNSGATGIDQSPYAPGTDAGEKYVGLKGAFGSIELGNIASPYKYTGGVMWDAFVTTDLQARGNGGMSAGVFGQNGFMSNSILYQSPDFSGFHVAFAYSPMNAGVNGSNPAGQLTAQHGDYAAAVQWKALGWSIFVARDHASAPAGDQTFKPYAAPLAVGNGLAYGFPANGQPGPGSHAIPGSGVAQNNTKFGVKYNFGPVAVMSQVENLQTSGEANPTRDYFLGVDGAAGHWTPVLQLGETTDKYFVGTDIKVSYVAVGTFYNFKKGFSLYGGYRRTRITGASSAVAVAAGASNGTQSVFSIGMRKVF